MFFSLNEQRSDEVSTLSPNVKNTSTKKHTIFIRICIVIIFINLFVVANVSYRRIYHPSVETTTQKVQVAHCMTGSPRTLYKEEVYTAYRRHALDILPGDLFAVLQLSKEKEVSHGTAISAPRPSSYQSAFDHLKPLVVTWIPEGDTMGAPGDSSGYAKWQRCLDLIKEQERQNGTRYDFIVRSRPDLFFAKALPHASLLPKDRVLVNPYYECFGDMSPGYNETLSMNNSRCDPNNLGISDIFAIVPRSFGEIYMGVAFERDLPINVCGARFDHAECRVKAVLRKHNVTYEFWPFVVKLMRSAEFCHSNNWNKFNSWC